MKICAFLTVLLLLSECGAGRYGSSYVSYTNPLLDPSLIALQEGQEPNLVRSNDLDRDVRAFREHNYVVVGESSFNGISENPELALKQAKEVGATHVVASSQFTDTASYLAYDYQDYYRTAVVRRVSTVNGQRVKYYDTVTVRDTVAVPCPRYWVPTIMPTSAYGFWVSLIRHSPVAII